MGTDGPLRDAEEPGEERTTLSPGVERTLSTIEEYSDRDTAIPVMASALEESTLARRALEFLLGAPEPRALREIVRRFHVLSRSARHHVVERGGSRLVECARQHAGSDRTRTRENVVQLIRELLDGSGDLEEPMRTLIQLVDDPRASVRENARRLFLGHLSERALAATRGDPQQPIVSPTDPIFTALEILLRQHEHHHDDAIVRTLLFLGEHGSDLLGRAVGEEWTMAEEIVRVLRRSAARESDPDGAVEKLIDGMFRWLRSPFPITREAARRVLRERTDAPFLGALLDRVRSLDGDSSHEYPVLRHIRWDRLAPDRAVTLDAGTAGRLAEYIIACNESAEERAVRIGRLLPHTGTAACARLLDALDGLPREPILDELATVAAREEEALQLKATQLVPNRGGRGAFVILVRQLASSFESVRSEAQRKISGHSVSLFIEAFSTLSPEERRAILPILERIDLHFLGQLTRALRSPQEETVVRALQTVVECDAVDRVQDGLFDLTVSPSPRIRATLTRALARAPRRAGLHYLQLFLEDGDDRVVANAIESLVELGVAPGESIDDDIDVSSSLDPLREHRNPRVRANTLYALSRIGSGATRDAARKELDDLRGDREASPSMRTSAAWAWDALTAVEEEPG